MDEESRSYSDKGYGKRPLWQWVVIYLVVGLIIYGLLYYFVLARRNTPSSNTGNQTPQQQGY